MSETTSTRSLMMSTARFLDHVREGYDAGIRYCFILGSGASVTSGIPMGRTLIEEWRSYLLERGHSYIRECAADIEMDYASIAPLFSPSYKVDSADYFTFYDLRFAGMPIQAYSYLQNLMNAAEPSFGYFALAVLLEYTKNKLVITTNFDSLVEETLSLYHAERPLVLGHESLATFMDNTENTGRSVIAKVHRDLLLHPKNSKEDMKKLAENWAEPLRKALSSYTPIVIGYAGGDRSLMSFLEGMQIGTVFWCTLGKSENDEDGRITDFLRKQDHGYLVNIRGFDEVMYGLLDSLLSNSEFDKPNVRIRNHAEQRATSYQTQLKRIIDSFTRNPTQGGSTGSGGAISAQTPIDSDYDVEPSMGSASESSLQTLEQLATLDSDTATEEDKAAEQASLALIRGAQAFREGRLDEALKEYTEAVRLEPGNAEYRRLRGITLYKMGRYEEAERIYREIHDDLGLANVLKAMGDLHLREGDLDGAAERYAEAERIYRVIHTDLGLANVLKAMGDLHLREGDLDGAAERYAEAESIYRDIHEGIGLANVLKAMGDLGMRTGDLGGAAERYEEAERIYRANYADLGLANVLMAMGDLHLHEGDLDLANVCYAEAEPIYRANHDDLGLANVLKAMGDLHLRESDLCGAAEFYAEA